MITDLTAAFEVVWTHPFPKRRVSELFENCDVILPVLLLESLTPPFKISSHLNWWDSFRISLFISSLLRCTWQLSISISFLLPQFCWSTVFKIQRLKSYTEPTLARNLPPTFLYLHNKTLDRFISNTLDMFFQVLPQQRFLDNTTYLYVTPHQ